MIRKYTSADAVGETRLESGIKTPKLKLSTSGSLLAGLVMALASATALAADTDGDGVVDNLDNCIILNNGPDALGPNGDNQRDTDGDGYGNICDADLNNDGFVNTVDYAMFRAAFGGTAPLTPEQENADLNGNGTVNTVDYAIFRSLFGKAPGPSAFNQVL